MQSQTMTLPEDQISTPYERSRTAVTDYYTTGAGATDTEPFALLFFLRDQDGGATVQELCASRLTFMPEAKPFTRASIRRSVYKGIERAERHRLVVASERRYVLTVKGRQFVMGGLHSRAAMLKRIGGRHSVMEVCMLCTEEELAPSVQQEAPPHAWPTVMGSSWLGAWLGGQTANWPPAGWEQAAD